MPKQKSSATSSTRKKHARKAAGPVDPSETLSKEKKPKGKDKGKNKEPRQKVYIPPVKPIAIQPDPLDTTGLAHQLPPELLVVLRRLGKKDTVTKKRALEELQSGWVDVLRKEGDDSPIVGTLVTMLPVWMHHVPALFLHPSKRIRLLAVGLYTSLLHITAVRKQILFFLYESATPDQAESILGSWCMIAHDIDRQVSSYAFKSWVDAIGEGDGKLLLDEAPLLSFIQRAMLDPSGVYLHLNPAPPAAAPAKKIPGRAFREEVDLRMKAEEDEENEQDRKARLRVGSLGSVAWILNTRAKSTKESSVDDLIDILCTPALWSSLYHAEIAPYAPEIEAYGWGQPLVRKSAWATLRSLLQHWKGSISRILPVLSAAVLRSVWVEPDSGVRSAMWQPLLMFLKDFPDSWNLAATYKPAEDYSDSDHSDDEDQSEAHRNTATTSHHVEPSTPYREFLQFLEHACSGSPAQGYPTVVIILSTIASPILAPLSDFFASFWAAIDDRALSSLDRAVTSAAFLASLLECTVFLVRRLRSDSTNHAVLCYPPGPEGALSTSVESANRLVGEQFIRIWDELTANRLKIQPVVAAKSMAQTLASLERGDPGLFHAAWIPLSGAITKHIRGTDLGTHSIVFSVLKTFSGFFEDGTQAKLRANALVKEVAHWSLSQCETALNIDQADGSIVAGRAKALVDLMDAFGPKTMNDPEFSSHIDAIAIQHAARLVTIAPSLLLIYLAGREDEGRCLQLWHAILSAVAQQPEQLQLSLPGFLQAARNKELAAYLKPQSNELDGIVERLLENVLGGSAKAGETTMLSQVLSTPHYFLSIESSSVLLKSIVSSITFQVDHALHDPTVSLHSFEAPLDLLLAIYDPSLKHISAAVDIDSVLPDIFVLAYLLPSSDQSVKDSSVNKAGHIWDQWLAQSSSDQGSAVFAIIKEKIRDLLFDVGARPSPENILHCVDQSSPFVVNLLHDIFSPQTEINRMLDALPSDPIDASLSVLDPLLSYPSVSNPASALDQVYDSRGFSAYARVASALLQVFTEDRQLAKQNLWALRHLLAFSIYADDLLQVPTALSPVFGRNISPGDLRGIVSSVQQIATYLLGTATDDGFHQVIVAISDDKPAPTDNLSKFLLDLVITSTREENARDSRILYRVLQHVFSNISKDEADQWLVLSRRLEKTAPRTSITITAAITGFAPEPSRLDRYRNELAADLFGVPATKANTTGLQSLRKLAATAPDPESDVVFLPQQRVINVMKTCKQWIMSGEDVDEDVESEMTLIFFHFAPLLQNVPGAHWDLVFDVIENNLESCSLTDDSALVILARTLRLIIAIEDLASTNKSLRDDWHERRLSILTLVRNLVEEQTDIADMSTPRSTCRELVLHILQDLPSSLIDHETLSKMCHLLTDSSSEVQKMAYGLLQEAAKKRTEYLVIEAGVDTENIIQGELPPELISILQRSFNSEDDQDRSENALLGYLLSWMVTFDLFTDASMKVRSDYVNHLRNLDLISTKFIPNIFNLLNLYDGVKKAFKLDYWGIDEYYIDYYESGTILSLQLLASHLFYRALLTIPSLIRKWLLDCTDRQLSSTVVSYTSQHFSPVIIRTELAYVKSPDVTYELSDETMTIKVAQAVNEVTASYLVDEHHLEITLKMPNDWPLHTIEIKDLKKVGVLEDRWRAWVLGVQQIIWSQNGRIVDGLRHFKKNVALHFEGQVECAICYSIISVMDSTLPRKPCRTCKNRFHAACLYKWFNTSHSSSCPLCRSDIM